MGIIRPAIGQIDAGSKSADLGLSDRRHKLAGVARVTGCRASEHAARRSPDRRSLRFRRL